MKRVSQADTVAWVNEVLSGAQPQDAALERSAQVSQPETPTSQFIREALGEPAPLVPAHVRNRALVVLLEAEQDRRRALKQEAI